MAASGADPGDREAAWAVVVGAPVPAVLISPSASGVDVRANPAAESLLGPAAARMLQACADADPAALLARARQGAQPSGDAALRAEDGSLAALVHYRVRAVGTLGAVCWLTPATEYGTQPSIEDAPGQALRQAVARAVRHRRDDGRSFALALVEVVAGDPDTTGTPGRDEPVPEVMAVLRAGVRGHDRVLAAGSGRVALLAEGLDGPAATVAFLNRLREETVPRLTRLDPVPGVAVGVVVDPAEDPDAVVADAAAALAEARASLTPAAPAVTVVYDEGAPTAGAAPVTSADLLGAIDRGELLLHFQPVVDVHDWRCGGAEALLRWQHPQQGLLAPREFLGRLEADASDRLGAWVVDAAVAQVARWERVADLDYFRVGINISPWELVEADLVGTFAAALQRHGVSGHRFAVEILETEELAGRGRAAQRIRDLRDLGLRVAIDDFGSGFATMSYLRDLPVDLVKVDRTLIGTHPGRRDEAILAALASVADAIGADVVLEGVEQVDQVVLARRVGVRFAQGLLLGPPAAAAPDRLPQPLPPPAGLA